MWYWTVIRSWTGGQDVRVYRWSLPASDKTVSCPLTHAQYIWALHELVRTLRQSMQKQEPVVPPAPVPF